jgi:hypothetical protein
MLAEKQPGESGWWHVRVSFGVPLLGPVGEYEGNVTTAGEPA